jgi:hypothetical protein
MAQVGGFDVVLESLYDEATKWEREAGKMRAAATRAGQLSLLPSAFFFEDLASTALHWAAYKEFQEWMVDLLNSAHTEFLEMRSALQKSADWYQEADHGVSHSLKEIYGTPPEAQ